MTTSTIQVTIRLGSRTRTVSASELSEALGIAGLADALAGLVLGQNLPQSIHKRRGTIGGGDGFLPGNERISKDRSRSFVQEENNCSVGAGQHWAQTVDDSPERMADFLAERLDDRKSLAWYALVARTLTRSQVRDLLTQVLDVPDHAVRRSRAALFTALARQAMADGSPLPPLPN